MSKIDSLQKIVETVCPNIIVLCETKQKNTAFFILLIPPKPLCLLNMSISFVLKYQHELSDILLKDFK